MFCKTFYCFIYLVVSIHNTSGSIENVSQKAKEVTNPGIELPIKASHSEVNPVQKGHILFFHNAGTRSHLIAMNALAEGLVEHGHQVTSVIYAESKIVNDNYKEILIEDK